MLEPVSTEPTTNSDEKAAKPKMVNVCEAHLKN